MPSAASVVQGRLDRLHRHPQQRHRVQHGGVAQVGQLVERQQRALAELGHVGHQRSVDLAGERSNSSCVGQRLGEDPIGAGVQVAPWPGSTASSKPSTPRASVRAMITRSGSSAGGGGGPQLGAHLVRRRPATCPTDGRSAWAAPGLRAEWRPRRPLPARCTVRSTFTASPKPVSASTISGIDACRVSQARLLGQLGEREQADVGQRPARRPRTPPRTGTWRRSRPARSAAPTSALNAPGTWMVDSATASRNSLPGAVFTGTSGTEGTAI